MSARRVLIADDDPTFVNVMRLRCRFLGLEVQTAPDAMFALTLVHKDPPALVLLDVSMPAGNGLAVCDMLASDQRLCHIPVIVITGRLDEQTVQRCEALRIRCFLKTTELWDRLKPIICELCGISAETGIVPTWQ
ncbi:MAG: response regulator [Phycisphaerae bacterium]|jgi:chemosensory pili system protein ChpA (sensor histidine kinase/response regulator)